MANRILINGSHHHKEIRVAVTNGSTVNYLDIESTHKVQKKANVYKGVITRIEPSLEAAFVNYGEERHGFLPLKEISPHYFKKDVPGDSKTPINEVLEEGMEVIVQVEKEERGNKGAALTTYITIAGSYLVLMPNTPKAGGVSRRIEGEDRDELCELLRQLNTPEKMGVIIRTASVGKSIEELQWDLDNLLKLWDAIQNIAKERPAPFLIHQESNVIIRAIRDYLRNDIDEVLIDQKSIYDEAIRYINLICPDYVNRTKLYEDSTPLFSRFQIENQTESIFEREIRLPSGGSIVIDVTEALVAVDINSARATKGSDIEETALRTNMEASEEIARQLRLRDIGGLIVIDFIDMTVPNHQRDVEENLKNALRLDRARVQVGRISRFGLLEMSRQRLRSSLGENNQLVCPHCVGRGTIRSVESSALAIIRAIEDNALKGNTAQIRVYLPVDTATYVLNEKRKAITALEKRHQISVLIIPNNRIQASDFEIERIKRGDIPERHDNGPSSYLIAQERDDIRTMPEELEQATTRSAPQEPALKSIEVASKPPTTNRKKASLLSRLLGSIFGTSDKKPSHKGQQNRPHQKRHRSRNRHNNNNRRHHRSGNRTGNRNNNRRRYEERSHDNANSSSSNNQNKVVNTSSEGNE